MWGRFWTVWGGITASISDQFGQLPVVRERGKERTVYEPLDHEISAQVWT